MAKVRKKEDGILTGPVTSVLTQEFVVATNTEGYDQTRVKLAFTSRKLPTSEETLKLVLHLRQVGGCWPEEQLCSGQGFVSNNLGNFKVLLGNGQVSYPN